MRAAIKNTPKAIYAIAIFGFLFRLLFIFKINPILSPPKTLYQTGDSSSYFLSIINLINNGKYMFDLNDVNSAFGRLPGYPTFWGIIYLLTSGKNTFLWVAIVQGAINSISIILLYKIIVKNGYSHIAGTIAALIYATYFFVLVWIPKSTTETFATDIVILLLFVLSSKNLLTSKKTSILLGVILSLCFYTREYLGMLWPIILFWFFLQYLIDKKKEILVAGFLFSIVFLTLYSLWPIRNYISYNRIEFLKPPTAGYKNYGRDYISFRSWVYCWHTDVEPYHSQIIYTDNPVVFPSYVYNNNKQFVDSLIYLCRHTGSGFYHWKNIYIPRGVIKEIDTNNQDILIEKGFNFLKKDFINRHPYIYYVKTPLNNLKYGLFKISQKSSHDGGIKNLLSNGLFIYRSILILFGIVGLFYMRKSALKFTIACFFVGMYLLITIWARQVEIRYLLQADVALIIPAAILIAKIFTRKPTYN